jgi:hypothetical protein
MMPGWNVCGYVHSSFYWDENQLSLFVNSLICTPAECAESIRTNKFSTQFLLCIPTLTYKMRLDRGSSCLFCQSLDIRTPW